MNLKRNRLRAVTFKNRTIDIDGEGVPSETFSLAGTLTCEVWPATSRLQVETYGDRVSTVKNVRIKEPYTIAAGAAHNEYVFGTTTITEGDGLCIDVAPSASPDYRIVSIQPYRHLQLEVERI